jgi:hypothetical protein
MHNSKHPCADGLFRTRRKSDPSMVSALDWPSTTLDKNAHKPHYVVTPREQCARGAKADTAGFALEGPLSVTEGRRASCAESPGVVVRKLQVETGAGLSPRSAPRAGCAARLFPAKHRAHAAMVLHAPAEGT